MTDNDEKLSMDNKPRADGTYEGRVDSEGRDTYEIRELDINQDISTTKKRKTGVKEANCDQCILNTVAKIAFYLCYMCDIYLCYECLSKHSMNHEFVKLESEKNERELMAELFIGGMRDEKMREEGLLVENTRVYGKVNIKQGSDEKECALHGLCKLEKRKWVILDSNNSRLKIYSAVTNALLRCIRFGAQPWEATEIHVVVKQKTPDSACTSDGKTNTPKASVSRPDEHSLLAVAFPWIKQIWLIDVNKTPAVKKRAIPLDDKCWSIDFCDGKIFCLCVEYVGLAYSIHILSPKGKMLKVLQNDLLRGILPNFVCLKDRIYLSDYPNNKVLCIKASDGSLVSELKLEGCGPAGITVDYSDNVFVCAKEHDKVYKLSPDLSGFESLSLDAEFTKEPDRLCFVDNKLLVGHYWGSELHNFVTAIQLT